MCLTVRSCREITLAVHLFSRKNSNLGMEGSGPSLFGRQGSQLAGRCRTTHMQINPRPKDAPPPDFPRFPSLGQVSGQMRCLAALQLQLRAHTQTSMRHKSAGGDADTDAAPPPCGPRRQSGPSEIRSEKTPCTKWNILASSRGEGRGGAGKHSSTTMPGACSGGREALWHRKRKACCPQKHLGGRGQSFQRRAFESWLHHLWEAWKLLQSRRCYSRNVLVISAHSTNIGASLSLSPLLRCRDAPTAFPPRVIAPPLSYVVDSPPPAFSRCGWLLASRRCHAVELLSVASPACVTKPPPRCCREGISSMSEAPPSRAPQSTVFKCPGDHH
jgi:hypothetical protein